MAKISELIVDAYECDCDLSDLVLLERAARSAVESVGATVVDSVGHRFQPHGATLCLILKESHFVISTWPEHRFATVNIFLCNEGMSTEAVWKEFRKTLKPTKELLKPVTHAIESLTLKKKAS